MTTVLYNRCRRSRRRQPAVWSACALIGLSLAAGTATIADDRVEQLRTQRQQQIEGLSEIERSRLQRNFSEFRNLSEGDREKLRQLDRDLKENDRSGGGNLRKIMEEYCTWLGTISISQREELRKTTDPKEREQLVRSIRKEQESATRPESPSGWWRRGPVLSRKDLDAVMRVLEDGLREEVVDVHQREELDKRQGVARHVYLIEILVKHEAPALREVREAYEQGRPPQFRPRTPLPLIEKLAEAVTNEQQRKFLLGLPPPDRLRHLFRMIWAAIRTERPTEQQLEEFFVTLKASQHDELMRLSPERMQLRLAELYMEQHPEKYPPLPSGAMGLFPFVPRTPSSRDGGEGDQRRKPFGQPGDRRGPGGFREKPGPPRNDAEKGPAS